MHKVSDDHRTLVATMDGKADQTTERGAGAPLSVAIELHCGDVKEEPEALPN